MGVPGMEFPHQRAQALYRLELYILPQRLAPFTPHQQCMKMPFALCPFHHQQISFKKIVACFGEKE